MAARRPPLSEHAEDHLLACLLAGDDALTYAEQRAAARAAYRWGQCVGWRRGFDRSFDERPFRLASLPHVAPLPDPEPQPVDFAGYGAEHVNRLREQEAATRAQLEARWARRMRDKT